MATSAAGDPSTCCPDLLKCSGCGANYCMGDAHSYVCASRVNGGEHACGNQLRLKRTELEDRILAAVRGKLLTPPRIAEFRRQFSTRLAACGAE